MGRYSTEPAAPLSPQSTPSNIPNSGSWPLKFDKPVVGLDLSGTIVEDVPLTGPSSIKLIPGAVEGIRLLRMKGHKVFILSDQPNITKGIITQQNIDDSFKELMSIFGKAGIYSIDGFLYNTSDMKADDFAKPNLGMVRRAEKEIFKNSVKFKDGWYVGDSLVDLKFADNMGARPILVKSGKYNTTKEQLEKFTYRELQQKTKIYTNLLEFANSLP